MGCFNSTCCISGLTITENDDVRWFLLTQNPWHHGKFVGEPHGRWIPRTWPLRAKYNHYGSIKAWSADDPLVAVVMEGLRLDLVELGVGENEVHDVATSRDMTFDALLKAVWEGRVYVERAPPLRERRQARLLQRIRELGLVGSVFDRADAPRDPPPGGAPVEVPSSEPPLLVQQGMVREDVWQALLALPLGHKRGIEDYRGCARGLAYHQTGAGVTTSLSPFNDAPFLGLLTRELTSALDLAEHTHLLRDLQDRLTPIVVQDMAEFCCIRELLHPTRFTFRPSDTSGPQDAMYELEAMVAEAIAQVAIRSDDDSE